MPNNAALGRLHLTTRHGREPPLTGKPLQISALLRTEAERNAYFSLLLEEKVATRASVKLATRLTDEV